MLDWDPVNQKMELDTSRETQERKQGALRLPLKYSDQRQLQEESVYFDYIFTSQSIINGSQSKNLEAVHIGLDNPTSIAN